MANLTFQQVRVSDLLGGSLGKLSVTAETARHTGDDAVVLSKKAFSESKTDRFVIFVSI